MAGLHVSVQLWPWPDFSPGLACLQTSVVGIWIRVQEEDLCLCFLTVQS